MARSLALKFSRTFHSNRGGKIIPIETNFAFHSLGSDGKTFSNRKKNSKIMQIFAEKSNNPFDLNKSLVGKALCVESSVELPKTH